MQLEDLLDAVEDGDFEAVQLGVEQHKIDPNEVDEEGFSPLMLAAHCGQNAITEFLLEHKANVNYVAQDSSDALMCAVQGGYEDICTNLIGAKAEVNAREEDAFSPLYSAAQEGHADIVKMLLKRKASVNAKCQGVSALFIAAQENHLPVVQSLLLADCDVNATNPSLATPLFIAVQKGNTSVVKSLIKRKKKVLNFETCTKQGLSALIVAIKIGHLDETKLLLAGGADINRPVEADGMTPLMTAAMYGDIDVVEELVAGGADVNAKNKAGDDAAAILMREFGEDLQQILNGQGLSSERVPPPPPPKKKVKKKHKKKHKKSKAPSKGEGGGAPVVSPSRRMDVATSQDLANSAKLHFQKYDVDRSGSLEKNELLQCLDDMGCRKQLGDEKFGKLVDYSFKTFDKNKDGRLDFEEYVQLYNKLQATIERLGRRKQANVVVDDHSVTRRQSVAAAAGDDEDGPDKQALLPDIGGGSQNKHKKHKKGLSARVRRTGSGEGGPTLHKPGGLPAASGASLGNRT